MKITRILSMIALMAIGFSCSKDDDAKPSVEEAKISLAADAEVIVAPEALLASDDEHAQMAAGWIEMANGLGSSLALFTPPVGATKSTEVITPINGRVAAGSAVVYYWSDGNMGKVAFQIRDRSDKFTYELFYEGSGTTGTGWYRYLYAEEMKDKSSGYMALYDIWGFMSDDRNEVMTRWDWSRSGDNFTFKMSEFDYGFSFTMTVNTKTKAGSIEYNEGTITLYEMAWDAQGKGTWKQYDDEGTLFAEGSWE